MDSGGYSVCPRSPTRSRAGEALEIHPARPVSPLLEKRPLNPGLYSSHLSSLRFPIVSTNFFLLTCRLPLPEPWRGFRDEALDQVSGIPGCTFVHANGFIGGHHTREGALSMARATLAQRPVPMPPTNPLVQ